MMKMITIMMIVMMKTPIDGTNDDYDNDHGYDVINNGNDNDKIIIITIPGIGE